MRVAEIFRSIQGEGFLTGTESLFVRASGCNLRCAYCDTPYASWAPEGTDLAVDEILARLDKLARLRWDPPASVGSPRLKSTVVATRHSVSVGRPTSNGTTAGREPRCPFDRQSVAEEAQGNVRHVVITGGEPMLFPEVVPLTMALRTAGHHITIETAGTRFLPVECDLMSISPKCSNSTPSSSADANWVKRHETRRHAPEVIRRLVGHYDYQVKFVVATLDDCREVEAYLGDFPELDRSRVMLMPQGTDAEELARMGQWLVPYCEEHELTFCPRRHVEWFGRRRGT